MPNLVEVNYEQTEQSKSTNDFRVYKKYFKK